MESAHNKVMKKLDYLDKLLKKVRLLEKKEEKMGLTEEEKDKLKELRVEYYFTYDDMVEDVATHLVNSLMTAKAKTALATIQKFVPWKGGMILTEEEFRSVIIHASILEDSDFDFLEEQLQILHSEVFDEFEIFANTENSETYCLEFAKTVSFGQNVSALCIVDYLDARYREFGDLLGLELEAVEVIFDK